MKQDTIVYNAKNERAKREYFIYMHEARGRAQATVDAARKAIHRYEEYTQFKDLYTFNKKQAVGFKKNLLAQKAKRSGQPVSLSTALHTLNVLKDFFAWLASQPGYKSRIARSDIDYLSLTTKDTTAAHTTHQRLWPTLEQVRRAIELMPTASEIDRRNRALMAFAIVTGMRDSAIATIRLKHIDLDRQLVCQDPREVKTKFSKSISTTFFPVGDDLKQIVADWVKYLRTEKLFGPDDPVFPKTKVLQDENNGFKAEGLTREFWAETAAIRKIFHAAFTCAGLPYFNPHSFRKTITDLGQRICQTPEQFKAWSQNLGHESPLTTFTSYGHVSSDRQAQLIQEMTSPRQATSTPVTKEDLDSYMKDILAIVNPVK